MISPSTRRKFLANVAVAVPAIVRINPLDGQAASSARSKVVDSHVHLKHGDAARTEFSARTIVDVMNQAGIDQSVVFAMCTTTKRSIAMAEAAVAEFPDRLIPYAYALPSYERPVLQELEAALKGGVFRGIKIHASECVLTDYVIDPVLKLAGRLRVPCLIDATGNVAAARRIAEAFPDTAVIFAHMGKYTTTDGKLVDAFIKLAGEHERVFLDLSGVALEAKIGEAAARVGAAKLIWGTDGPYAHPDLVTYARNELAKVRRLALGQSQTDAILGGNLLKLIRQAREV
jgi:predicted TIM-barrel fold metal-dependent hydrolase